MKSTPQCAWSWVLFLATVSTAWSAPGLINYQGRLTDASGKPVSEPVQVTFTFWDHEVGGAALGKGFSDTDLVTNSLQGIFSTVIGDEPNNLIPSSIFENNAVWLNVNVRGEDLVPRKRITSVPYALRSELATTATYAESAGTTSQAEGGLTYRPWWRWWWWPLPWRLGYTYERTLAVAANSQIDPRGALYDALAQDVQANIPDQTQAALTLAALDLGRQLDPSSVMNLDPDTPPALVVLLEDVSLAGPTTLAVRYVLVSNRTSTDPDPRAPSGTQNAYPWIPGRCYHWAQDVAKNTAVDLDAGVRAFHQQLWIQAGGEPGAVGSAMLYFFVHRCGTE